MRTTCSYCGQKHPAPEPCVMCDMKQATVAPMRFISWRPGSEHSASRQNNDRLMQAVGLDPSGLTGAERIYLCVDPVGFVRQREIEQRIKANEDRFAAIALTLNKMLDRALG